MIVVKITGGLGNQFFQYAFGRWLSIKNKTDLGVNSDSYRGNKKDSLNRRVSHLEDFNTNFKDVSTKELKKYLFITGNKFIDDYFLLKRRFLHKKAFFEGEDLSKLDKERDICIKGYFADYKYPDKIKKSLSKELSLKNKENIKRVLSKIKKQESVSIHVRRGDLEILKNTNLLTKEYYEKAIGIMKNRVKNPKFYIFSDNIAWCKENFKWLKEVKFIEGNSVSEDFELMKNWKNNIMANSTLSWWATYLNPNKNKIIIQPMHMGYFKDNNPKGIFFKEAIKVK
jgi:hypothetical protein